MSINRELQFMAFPWKFSMCQVGGTILGKLAIPAYNAIAEEYLWCFISPQTFFNLF